MLRRRLLLRGATTPPVPGLRRAFRSDASLKAIRAQSHSTKTTAASASDGPMHLALYNYPTFGGAYAALAAHLFHRRLRLRLLLLPFSSVEPFRFPLTCTFPAFLMSSCLRFFFNSLWYVLLESKIDGSSRAADFEDAGFETCYLLDFFGPKNFALELSQFIPSVIAFDHRRSTMARISHLGHCPSNLELNIDTTKSSARAVFDYLSKKFTGKKPDSDMCEKLLDQEDEERVLSVLKYIEDADLRKWQLPNTKEFQTALRDERGKLNCVTNPLVFEQGGVTYSQSLRGCREVDTQAFQDSAWKRDIR
ncbi:hypothetical protein GUJ93_ZPchr0011g28544 [Zizania palustris]|uniref:Uncharacterized protein n=1 Tax=Zizania palustris TaxID=103762 RepID=A0A8J5WGP2_ZIZPA|nr:hypothetical protein GUJ93_ZPchr0011g28544 [Zizania palustris]